MKKLSRIKLHDAVEMTDNEMKKVMGGFGTGESGGGDNINCPGPEVESSSQCSAECTATVYKDDKIYVIPGTCVFAPYEKKDGGICVCVAG